MSFPICQWCKGTGRQEVKQPDITHVIDCHTCRGSGLQYEFVITTAQRQISKDIFSSGPLYRETIAALLKFLGEQTS